jgi:hypothetical protein
MLDQTLFYPTSNIDVGSNRYYPTSDPRGFLRGFSPENVDRNSLLIHDRYFSQTPEDIRRFGTKISHGIPLRLDDPEEFNYLHYLKIKLAAGLSIAFRRLLGLPVSNHEFRCRLN